MLKNRFLSAAHSERRAEAPGARRAEIMLSAVQGFLRLNVPKPLASSEIYPRVKILLWSQEMKQWNRLPLHPFLFFFLWPTYCDADVVHFAAISHNFKRMRANMTHTST